MHSGIFFSTRKIAPEESMLKKLFKYFEGRMNELSEFFCVFSDKELVVVAR